jgi:hypothetical protein
VVLRKNGAIDNEDEKARHPGGDHADVLIKDMMLVKWWKKILV